MKYVMAKGVVQNDGEVIMLYYTGKMEMMSRNIKDAIIFKDANEAFCSEASDNGYGMFMLEE